MTELENIRDLLFIDTFSHETSETEYAAAQNLNREKELNLDLVQFPRPVYVSEVRIIPLGARVLGDFPGGVRLGATNPTQFQVHFYVNNLSKPGASSFEDIGCFQYCQNGVIHMECLGADERRIPTDGLVLKGFYTTITLAVYGSFSRSEEDMMSPEVHGTVTAVHPPPRDWNDELTNAIPTYTGNIADIYSSNYPQDSYETEIYRTEYYEDGPKDPRSYHLTVESVPWDKDRGAPETDHDLHSAEEERRELRSHRSRSRDHDRARSQDSSRHTDRSRDCPHSRSHSRERDYESVRERGAYHSRSRSPSYRDRGRAPSDEKDWDRDSHKNDEYKRHNDSSYERTRASSYDTKATSYDRKLSPYNKRGNSYDRMRAPSFEKRMSYERLQDVNYVSPIREDSRKRPRSPEGDVSRRPHTPVGVSLCEDRENLSPVDSILSDEGIVEFGLNGKQAPPVLYPPDEQNHILTQKTGHNYTVTPHSALITINVTDIEPIESPKLLDSPHLQLEDTTSMDAEQFEPILSDEDICDDMDGGFGEIDYELTDYPVTDEIMKYYNPLKAEWVRYVPVHNPQICILPHVMTATFGELCAVNKDLSKLYDLCRISKKRDEFSDIQIFSEASSAAKEEWVHRCEQLPLLLAGITSDSDIILRIFKTNNERTKDEFVELFNFITEVCQIGLNYEFAISQTQPTYKIRHLKCGIRLVEALSAHNHSGRIVSLLLNQNIDMCFQLLVMYSKDYMALSIRLMILKALDTCLSSREAIEHFLQKHDYSVCQIKSEYKLRNGYQTLIYMLQENPLARVKFAINALIKKLNTYELLQKLCSHVIGLSGIIDVYMDNDQELSEGDTDFIIDALDEIIFLYRSSSFHLSQPKRFLPVSAQFDINKDCSNKTLLDFFQIHKLAETCLFLLTSPLSFNYLVITSPICELLSELIHSSEGLYFLSKNMETSELLFRYLLLPIGFQNSEDTVIFSQDINSYSDLQLLGLEMAYKLKALYYLEGLADMSRATQVDESELVDTLQALYCLTLGNIGKLALASILSMGDNIQCLLNIFEKDAHTKNHSKNDAVNKQKFPAKSYAVDLTVGTIKYSTDVRFLQKYGKRILNVAKKYDAYEQNIATMLQEALPYLKPLEKPNIFSNDNVTESVEVLKTFSDDSFASPGELITTLRILKYFGVPDYEDAHCEISNMENIELKYKYNILQLYSQDGITLLVGILEKLCSYYEQPNLHTASFASLHGLSLAQVALPALQLLNRMLTHVIRCRNTQFKDLTAVPVLLQTYSLMRSYPNNAVGYDTAQRACKEAIQTLLAFTQPIAEDSSETESVHKTLWTLLCGEVIKYILTAPYTFVPGLLALSELLPLPLPVPTKHPLSDSETANLINNRKLWSAHLHTLATNITEMIQTICISAYRPVVQMLRRVCVQIADLASNMAVIVTRAVVASILHEVKAGEAGPTEPCTYTVCRLLGFLACLVAHASVKCTVLSLIKQGAAGLNAEDRLWLIVPVMCDVLRTPGDSPAHAQAQECVASIINSLCDTELTLMAPSENKIRVKAETSNCKVNLIDTLDVYLANSLPTKETLTVLLDATFQYLALESFSVVVISSILRTFFMLSEHDFGFYHFKVHVMKHKQVFVNLFKRIVNEVNKDGIECLGIYLELLRILQCPSDDVETSDVLHFTPRTNWLTSAEIAQIIGYSKDCDHHAILTLENILKEQNADEDLLANAAYLALSVQRGVEESETESVALSTEPSLPAPEALAAQFAGRAACTQGDAQDERLTEVYWLNVPSVGSAAEDDFNDGDVVSCDIAALAKSELASGGGADELVAGVEKLLRLGGVGGDRKQHKEAAKDRLQFNAMKEKRPFVSPMRGRGMSGGMPGAGTGGTNSGYASPTPGGPATPGGDAFRSRPPNTSRPPSLHVDDFVALEGRGAQPTGPTGYNKITQAAVANRGRGMRARGITVSDRGRFASSTPQHSHTNHYRQLRGRGAWGGDPGHFGHFPPNNAPPYVMGNGWNSMGPGVGGVGGRGVRGHRPLRHARAAFMR